MKTGQQRPRDSLGKVPTQIKSEKIAVGICQQILTAVSRQGRLTANGQISDRWEIGRLGRSIEVQTESKFSLSVDRSGQPRKTREHCSFSRSTGRLTEVHTCPVVHVGRPTEQFSSASGRPCGRSDSGQK